MELPKKGLPSNLSCEVCKMHFNSNADYALHEFSKRHCDNLIRLAKNKPIVSKQKVKHETPPEKKEPVKVNTITHTGSFAKYGYFIPGEIYTNPESSKEFNTEYDPYLQKFAENPYKEKSNLPSPNSLTTSNSVKSFNKKKKKKIKTCQVCNITLLTVPEYEAHMKSSEHIWKLKVTGMGVSAHFVKASSDLHTTEVSEETKINQTDEPVVDNSVNPSGPFPLLYCSDCELLLNSPQQFNAHVKGKSHIELAQRKSELKAKKEKLKNPSPNQLYCFTCKLSLNNLFQYKEHKNGKKHKTKCKNLIRKGLTIPPEERVPGIPLSHSNKAVVYPELYEKFILEKQNHLAETKSELQTLNNGTTSDAVQEDSSKTIIQEQPQPADNMEISNNVPKNNENQFILLENNEQMKCSICNEEFQWQSELDTHYLTENHLNSILSMKLNKVNDSQICSLLFSDRNKIKPNNLNKFTCSICNVTTDNSTELNQHMNSIVHKYTEKDYKTKRSLEVKSITGKNDESLFYCKLCKEGWPSLIDYCQHLHLIKHKTAQRAKRVKAILTKRKMSFIQKQKLQSKKEKAQTEKNPGVRTKVCGVAVDLNNGIQAQIPNLESLEPKIDATKNVAIGASRFNEGRNTMSRGPNKTGGGFTRNMRNASFILPRFPRPGFGPPNRFWGPYPSMFERSFCGRPYQRPPWFQRPPWPRHDYGLCIQSDIVEKAM